GAIGAGSTGGLRAPAGAPRSERHHLPDGCAAESAATEPGAADPAGATEPEDAVAEPGVWAVGTGAGRGAGGAPGGRPSETGHSSSSLRARMLSGALRTTVSSSTRAAAE